MSGTPPRRRHSPAVYRRRRLVLLLALLVVGAIVWLLIAQPWRGAASAPAQSTAAQHTADAATELPIPDASSQQATGEPDSSTPSADSTAALGAPACVKDDITVEALSDQDSYGSGQNPELSIRLTNTAEEDCALNVGTSTQVFTVSSGDDVWWRSTDCQSEPSDMVVLLAAGQSVTSAAPIVWDRTRSAVGTCDDAERDLAPGGGASYHLAVEIGGITSVQSKQLLLY